MTRGPLPKSCDGCPLSGPTGPTRPVVGIGPKDARYVVIAEGPGGQELIQGEPLVGPSGRMLNSAIERTGCRRDQVYLTNISLCKPPPGVDKEKVVAKAAIHCRDRLIEELAVINPNAPFLLLGKHAAQAFLGDKFKITELAGSYHEVAVPGLGKRRVVPTIHPAAILRGGAGEGDGDAHAADLQYWNLLYDVAKVRRLADGSQEPFTNNVTIEYASAQKAENLIEGIAREIRQVGFFACDTETIGIPEGACNRCPSCKGHSALQPMYAQLTAIGLATPDRAISVSWRILTDRSKLIVKELFNDSALELVAHNSLYDKPVLEAHGFKILNRVHDTMLLHHNAFPGLNHKLQRVATQFFLISNWKSEFRHGKGSLEELLLYNSKDTLTTARLKSPLQICVTKSNADRTYEMDLRMAEVASRMHVWGVPISISRNRELTAYFEPRIRGIEKSLAEKIMDEASKKRFFEVLATEKAKRRRKDDSFDFEERHAVRLEEISEDWDELNLKAGDQVVAFLKSCGVPLYQVTKKGKVSTKKDVLEALASNETVRQLLDYRAAEKLYSTNVAPLPYQVDNDSRVHPVWGVHMITGRWSSKPNWQNVSEGNEEKGIPNLRTQVVAPEGRVLVGADQEQLEARIVAMLSKEDYLLRAFLNGEDIHSEFAKLIFTNFSSLPNDDSPQGKLRKRLRNHTKTAEYGYIYGAAPMTVWKQSFVKNGHHDVTIKMVTDMFRVFRQRMPKVELWHAELFRKTLQEGKISSFLLGRSRWFPTGQADPTVVKNFGAQSGAADIVNTNLSRFYARMPMGTKILIQGHDSIVAECDEDKAELTKEILTDCMTAEYTVDGVTMKFPCKAKIGKVWSEV